MRRMQTLLLPKDFLETLRPFETKEEYQISQASHHRRRDKKISIAGKSLKNGNPKNHDHKR